MRGNDGMDGMGGNGPLIAPSILENKEGPSTLGPLENLNYSHNWCLSH